MSGRPVLREGKKYPRSGHINRTEGILFIYFFISDIATVFSRYVGSDNGHVLDFLQFPIYYSFPFLLIEWCVHPHLGYLICPGL